MSPLIETSKGHSEIDFTNVSCFFGAAFVSESCPIETEAGEGSITLIGLREAEVAEILFSTLGMVKTIGSAPKDYNLGMDLAKARTRLGAESETGESFSLELRADEVELITLGDRVCGLSFLTQRALNQVIVDLVPRLRMSAGPDGQFTPEEIDQMRGLIHTAEVRVRCTF